MMFRHLAGMLALAGIAAPAMASDAITLRNPAEFRTQMMEMGYAPDAGEPARDGTSITYVLKLKSETLAAVLAGCRAGLNCTYVVLVSSFSDVAKPPAAWVADRNANYDLIKVWTREDGKLAYGSGFAADGLPREIFRRWIDEVVAGSDALGQDAVKAGYAAKK